MSEERTEFEKNNPYADEARDDASHQIGWHELSLAILALAYEISKLAQTKKEVIDG